MEETLSGQEQDMREGLEIQVSSRQIKDQTWRILVQQRMLSLILAAQFQQE